MTPPRTTARRRVFSLPERRTDPAPACPLPQSLKQDLYDRFGNSINLEE